MDGFKSTGVAFPRYMSGKACLNEEEHDGIAQLNHGPQEEGNKAGHAAPNNNEG